MQTSLALSLIFLVTAVVLNVFLSFVVLRIRPHSATHRLYATLGLVMSLWLIANYVSVHPVFLLDSLFYIRLSIFLAVPMSLFFYLLTRTLPHDRLQTSRLGFAVLSFFAIAAMVFCISPYAFTEIEFVNGSPSPVAGPGIVPFTLVSTLYSFFAVYNLARKLRASRGEEYKQYFYVMLGIACMLGLVITTILIPVVVFKFNGFVPLIPLYTLIFLGMTGYAIVRHKLFSLKVVATEALTFLLLVFLLAKSIVTTEPTERAVDVVIFLAALIFGILLVKSVKREVEQRQRLETLSTQLSKANAKLKQLDQARADFITIASHQLRTPPATIKWYLASLKSGDYGALPKEAGEQVVKAEATNNSLISLIDDLLNASRIERGKMEFAFEPTNIEELVSVTVEQLRPLANMKGLMLSYKKPLQSPPLINADKEKLRQVINNFIDNAIKYTRQGSVTANLAFSKSEIRFSVTDTGKGIAPEYIKTIFEKYTRGNNSATHSTGLGLGLYVAKIIIAKHKGNIWAESDGENKGATFAFTLPLKSNLKGTSTLNLAEVRS